MPRISDSDYSNMTALAYWLEVRPARKPGYVVDNETSNNHAWIRSCVLLLSSSPRFRLNTLVCSCNIADDAHGSQVSKMRYNLTGALLGGSMLGTLSSYINDAIRALQEAARVRYFRNRCTTTASIGSAETCVCLCLMDLFQRYTVCIFSYGVSLSSVRVTVCHQKCSTHS